jgi:hypothetical protein
MENFNKQTKKMIFAFAFLLQSIATFSQKATFVSYTEKSKLEWTDFNEVTQQNADTSIKFNFDNTIHMKTTKVNVWTGVTTFEAFGIYKLPTTWIIKTAETNQLLEYLQLQFDISNSIAKKLETDINKRRINGAYKDKMKRIFDDYNTRLNKILSRMDSETLKGKNVEKTNEWRTKLTNNTLES